MESSIAVFLLRQHACERLPTNDFATLTPQTTGRRTTTAPNCKHATRAHQTRHPGYRPTTCKLTWLVLGGDPAARSHRVEQFTAL